MLVINMFFFYFHSIETFHTRVTRPGRIRGGKILHSTLEIFEAFFDRARSGCEHSTSFQSVNMQNKHGGSIGSHDMNKYKFFKNSASPKRKLSCCSWQQDMENDDEPCIILIFGRSYKNRNLNLECNDWLESWPEQCWIFLIFCILIDDPKAEANSYRIIYISS